MNVKECIDQTAQQLVDCFDLHVVGTCENCKYWGGGISSLVDDDSERKTCGSPKNQYHVSSLYSGYECIFFKDFGCIHWEGKND